MTRSWTAVPVTWGARHPSDLRGMDLDKTRNRGALVALHTVDKGKRVPGSAAGRGKTQRATEQLAGSCVGTFLSGRRC